MNKELLIENLEKKNNIILYFNSKGCGPCKQAKPIVKKIVESRKAHFYSDVVEGDTHSQALEQFCKVEFYPTLVIIENNEIEKAKAKQKRNEAMNKYRLKDIQKWRERAKVLAKKLYDKNKTNPEYLAKKLESAKKSILKKKNNKPLENV